MNNAETFRSRFRFRLQTKLNINADEYGFKIGERDVVLSPELPDLKIMDSEWLVMNASGFESEQDARTFANKLKAACEVSSVATRLGIDSGVNLPTTGFGKLVKDRVREQSGVLLRDNVHGVDVFLDDPRVKICHFSATGTVRAAPDPFLADINQLHDVAQNTSQKTKDMVLLLNYALLRPEPVAQIVFACSAVEMLGQMEAWSADQKRLLNELADSAKKAEIGTAHERHEVSVAIRKGDLVKFS